MLNLVPRRWLLLPSPLLGTSSWLGVAAALERRQQEAIIARTTMTTTATLDHVTPWVDQILEIPVPDDDLAVTVVAHSAAVPRVPYVAHRLYEKGWNIASFICVDGRFPDGRAFTVSEPTFGPMLDSIVRPDDYLPPWPRWWGSLIEGLVVDPAARDQVFGEARPIPRTWFDQGCAVPEMPDTIGRAFLSFGPGYAESCKRAAAEGWLTYHLAGDHLHQVVEPEAVANTLVAIADCIDAGS